MVEEEVELVARGASVVLVVLSRPIREDDRHADRGGIARTAVLHEGLRACRIAIATSAVGYSLVRDREYAIERVRCVLRGGQRVVREDTKVRCIGLEQDLCSGADLPAVAWREWVRRVLGRAHAPSGRTLGQASSYETYLVIGEILGARHQGEGGERGEKEPFHGVGRGEQGVQREKRRAGLMDTGLAYTARADVFARLTGE